LRYIWIYWHHGSELLGVSGLKEGVVVAVREQPPQREREKKNNLQEGIESTAPGKEEQAVHR
jgi:hypothetical protein